MFSHVMVGTDDLDKAKAFYDALFAAIGVGPGSVDRHRVFYRAKTGTFGVTLPIDGEPMSHANGGTIGFLCESPAQADAWHAAGLAAGGVSIEDPPGPRGGGAIYLAYLRDLDGNKLCTVHRAG